MNTHAAIAATFVAFVFGVVAGIPVGGRLTINRIQHERQAADRLANQPTGTTATATVEPVVLENFKTFPSGKQAESHHVGHNSTGSCGPFYALRDYQLSGELTALRPEDLPTMALGEDVYGGEDEYVIVEKVGSFTVKGPPIEIHRPHGGKTIEKLDLSNCPPTNGGTNK